MSWINQTTIAKLTTISVLMQDFQQDCIVKDYLRLSMGNWEKGFSKENGGTDNQSEGINNITHAYADSELI